MKMLVDLFSTDYGLMSVAVIVFMLGMAVWVRRFFVRKMREDEAERLAQQSLADSIGDNDDDDNDENASPEDVLHKFIFPYRSRRAHFKSKIQLLEKTIKDLKNEKHEIDAERSRLTEVMKRESKRKIELDMEKDRIKNFNGESITSSVLHGSSMRYEIGEFITNLEEVFSKTLNIIASSKFKVMAGENRKAEIKIKLYEAEELLKDRTGAFIDFTKQHERAAKAHDRMQGGENTLMKFFFDKLVAHINSRKSSRQTIERLFKRARMAILRGAFIKWSTGEHEKLSSNASAFKSKGSMLLQKAKETREEIQVLTVACTK